MGYHPRIESSDYADFLTSRTRNSELWFHNNSRLQDSILGSLAKYAEGHHVQLYAFALQGNHIHAVAQFQLHNRADFMRDFKAAIARAVPRYCPSYTGGSLWARRYSQEFIPKVSEDIEDRFFYTVLQPVQDGLVEKISQYPGYNCFHDAIWGLTRKTKVVNWSHYYEAKRRDPHAAIAQFTDVYTLEYKRLPGYEHLTQKQYALLMMQKLEERRKEIIRKRYQQKKGFAGAHALKKIPQGARPRQTKTSQRYSYRPRVLTLCPQRRKNVMDWYFHIYSLYKKASLLYRKGTRGVLFPLYTYKPFVSVKRKEPLLMKTSMSCF